MSHPFLIKEIALQASLGMATVDRLLNGRAHVREHTPRRIRQAIGEREEQQLTIATSGRKLVVDVVVEAPRRFVDENPRRAGRRRAGPVSAALSDAGDDDDAGEHSARCHRAVRGASLAIVLHCSGADHAIVRLRPSRLAE
ncbi:LacI family DNA-binding transcriptional regulator [Paraburkholderia hospita]|uniref:LacI family DNA-binding transcriptional regulator n=1 Tax=Paraburkholderia hospita TaxID=169430 RepID=UPI003BF9B5E4